MTFQGFPKVARLNREIVVTEKIDGTNAQIYIVDLENHHSVTEVLENISDWKEYNLMPGDGPLLVLAGSKNRYLKPGKTTDNHGFASWVQSNLSELLKLGHGRHYGEWWGKGINRRYNQEAKRFSLFNTHRWSNNPDIPECCEVVPVLYQGDFNFDKICNAIKGLEYRGSVVAPGFMKPEGIVVYHTAGNTLFKQTIEHDNMPKSKIKENTNESANA